MNFAEQPVYFMRDVVLIISFSFAVLIFNYFGQSVTSMNNELSKAAYGSLWYEQDMKFKRVFKAFLIYLDDEIVFEIKGIYRVDLENFVQVKRCFFGD
jgi:hypothetical protein